MEDRSDESDENTGVDESIWHYIHALGARIIKPPALSRLRRCIDRRLSTISSQMYRESVSKVGDMKDHLTFISLALTTLLALFGANYEAETDNR